MHDRVELLAPRLVREYDAAELRAVQGTVGQEDVPPERADDLRECGRARLDDLAREDVGIDDGEVVPAQKGGDGRLARRDAAGEADDCGRCPTSRDPQEVRQLSIMRVEIGTQGKRAMSETWHRRLQRSDVPSMVLV